MKVVVVQLGLITAAFLSGVAAVTVSVRAYNATRELDIRRPVLTLGTRVLLTCDVTGLPKNSEVGNYKWYHNCTGRPNSRCEIQDRDPYYRVVKDTLLVDVTSLDQGGRYYCNEDSLPVREAAITRKLAVAGNPAPFLYTPTSLLSEHSVLTDVQQATGRNGQQWITCRSGGQGTRPEIWMGSEKVVPLSSTNTSVTILLGSQHPDGLYHCLSAQSQREYFSLYLSSTVTLATPTVSGRDTSMWTLTSPDGSRVERYIVEFECRVRNITFAEKYMSVSTSGGTGQVATSISCFGGLGQLYRVKVWAVSGPSMSKYLVCTIDGQCREEEGGSQTPTTQLTMMSTSTLADNTESDGGGSTPPATTAAATTATTTAATTTTATAITATATLPPTTRATTAASTTIATTAVTTTTSTTTATAITATSRATTTTATTTATTTTATTVATTTTATFAAPPTTIATTAATTTIATTTVATTTSTTTAVTTTATTITAPPPSPTTTTTTTTARTTTTTTTTTKTTSIPTGDGPSSSPSANAPSSGPQHDWTFIGVGAGVGMFLLLLVLSLVVVLIVVVVVVRRKAAHKQKKDTKMGGNLDPNSIVMQEKETGADTHYKDARIYESAVKKDSGELEDRVNDNYYSYVLADMYVNIQTVSTPSVEESSASVTDGVYANAVTDTGHYDVPRSMGNMTETGNGGNMSGNVEEEGYYSNVVELRNEALANQ